MPADRWHTALNAYDLTLDARMKGSPTEWRVANKVWVQQGMTLQPAFLDLLVSRYGAPVAEADFAAFEGALDSAKLQQVMSSITEGGIHLSMPKWTARTHLSLNKALSDMGMPSAFGDADFSGMTGSKGLFLSAVEHEAFIEVDEKGTRAAAATGGAMMASHGPTVNVNKPFLHVVRDRGSGAVLFVGRVLDPSAAG
jgi:serine protease inhibitor